MPTSEMLVLRFLSEKSNFQHLINTYLISQSTVTEND